ncbi:MAG: Na+/H+ antiporter subunit E [Chloroflexota bacterium]
MSQNDGTNRATNGPARGGQPTMLVLFLSNLLIAFLWATFVPLFGGFDFWIGLLLGLVVLTLVNRTYSRRLFYITSFALYVLWQIIVSNVTLAWTIVQPKAELARRLNPGIVDVPLSVTQDLEILLLASVITLTPGTISVDLGHNEDGEPMLFVHSLQLGDVDAFRRELKDGFEARILRFSQGTTV